MPIKERSTKICTLQQIQILTDAIDDMIIEDVEELMTTFPFADLISINIMNRELLRNHIIFLLKLKDKELFYGKVKPMAYTLDFILGNLLSLEKVDYSEELLGLLLKLLRCLISQSKPRKLLCEVVQRERERVLEVLNKTTKLKTFGADHVDDSFVIISDLLDVHGVLPLTTSRYLAEIAEIFKGHRVVRELSLLTNIVFKRFTISSEVFIVCACWLLTYGPMYLKETGCDQSHSQIMKNLVDFYTKYNYIRNTKRHQQSDVLNALEDFLSTLSAIMNVIIRFCDDRKLGEDAINLVAIALAECYGEKWDVYQKKLRAMPADVSEWPRSKNELFFEVCAFLCRYSDPIWTSADIFRSISSLIYSYDRFGLAASHLKAVCLVYSCLLPSGLDKRTVLLGDDLLIVVEQSHLALDEILTRHPAQLCWMLKRGDYRLQKRVLGFWLREGNGGEELGDFEEVRKCVRWSRAGGVVEGMLMDRHQEEEVVMRSIELIRSLEDPILSSRIAMMICLVFRDETLFRRLILARPGIPQDRVAAMKLCEFMSIQLVYIRDDKVFSLGCAFCKNLLVSLKTEADVVTAFCRDLRTVKFLLIRLPRLAEEAAIEVLGLLKILVLVQKRNKTYFDHKLEVDLHVTLQGHPDKTDKSLDLLHLIVSKDLFLQLSPSTVESLFRKLFDIYTKRPELTTKSLLCMTEILRGNRWLASTNTTAAFVEVNCSLEVDERSWQEFVTFLGVWLRILNKHKVSGRYSVHFGIVRNYLRRVPYISQKKISNMQRILDQLEGMRRRYPLF